MWSEWVSREGSIRAFTTNPQYKHTVAMTLKNAKSRIAADLLGVLVNPKSFVKWFFEPFLKDFPSWETVCLLGANALLLRDTAPIQGFDPWMGAVLVPVGVPDMAPGATGTCGVLESLEFREILDPKGPRSGIHAFPLLQPIPGACALYGPPLLVCLGLRSISRFAPLGVSSTVGLRT